MNRFNNYKKEEPDISLDTFFEYFRKLNSDDSDNASDDADSAEFDIADIESFAVDNPRINEILNDPFSEDEVKRSISNLKNNKAAGVDGVLNEYLKNIPDNCITFFCKLFNLVLDTGIIPEKWL